VFFFLFPLGVEQHLHRRLDLEKAVEIDAKSVSEVKKIVAEVTL
jgi:hypothetical protein